MWEPKGRGKEGIWRGGSKSRRKPTFCTSGDGYPGSVQSPSGIPKPNSNLPDPFVAADPGPWPGRSL